MPLKALGRFVHEAAAVDPWTGIVYLTEDNGEPFDGFYRFLPRKYGRPEAGGTLQMLAVTGAPQYSTLTGQQVGAGLPVSWVTNDEPDPSDAEANPSAVFNQGFAKGGAAFLSLDGEMFPFAENTAPLDLVPFGGSGIGRSEFAGVQFSRRGRWLFCHVQYPGTTYAITGPWERGCL